MVAEAPDRTALGDASSGFSFSELWGRSADLARMLRERGIKQGDFVGLCVERSAAMVIGALAIMRAGAAYVAIDPAYPDDRVNWMLEDSGAVAVLADAANAPRFAGTPPVIHVDAVATAAGAAAGAEGLPEISETDLAYVVYTSGSTGTPKGVIVGHDNLVNLIEWNNEAFGVTEADRCTQVASPGFDAAVWEMWPALSAGATLLIVPEALRTDPGGLRDWLVDNAVTVSFLPTVVAESVIRMPWPSSAPLRHLLTGGDALTIRPGAGLSFSLVNNYGLSETTVVATSGVVEPAGASAPSIGRAIRGVQLHVVDDELRPVEAGAEGELLIGGAAVARGYLNRPELTAERFLDGPGGERRYRTGDRVRLDGDGEVEFLGRVDDQLSIRGFRVEPGEVVAALTAHPAVASAVVTSMGETGAERHLIAYVVAAGEPPAGEELDRRLARSLPAYMVPSRYVWLAALPLNAHGKVDRDQLERLAVPEETISGSEASIADAGTASAAPGDTAAEIAAIVAELLGVPAVEPDQNFFLLGGHSMLGAQLIVRIEERLGAEIGLRFLFDNPTAAQLAAEVDAQRADAGILVGQ
jgi:amino acid adenylation domain-containing protein